MKREQSKNHNLILDHLFYRLEIQDDSVSVSMSGRILIKYLLVL